MRSFTHHQTYIALLFTATLALSAQWLTAVTPVLPTPAAATATVAPDAVGNGIDAWRERLEVLRPERPMMYFELAEEIKDAGATEQEKELARHLFALAGVLNPDRLGRSAALALADMEEDTLQKQRFLALASLLARESHPVFDLGGYRRPQPINAETAVAVSESLSHFRQGRGSQSITALRQAEAEPLLRAYQHIIPGGFDRFLEDSRLYRGRQQPLLADEAVTNMLRFELALLEGQQRPWSSDLVLHRGQPLIEVDPQDLAASFSVNPERTIYRDGSWRQP